jgi:hypothetical protein
MRRGYMDYAVVQNDGPREPFPIALFLMPRHAEEFIDTVLRGDRETYVVVPIEEIEVDAQELAT